MDEKKIGVIRDWISNYIQSGIINAFLDKMDLPYTVEMIIKVATNIDKISIVQNTISMMGVYKYIVYAVYFLLFAA